MNLFRKLAQYKKLEVPNIDMVPESYEGLVIASGENSLSVNGVSTRLGLALLAMVGTFCFTLHSGLPASDAYIAMAIEGVTGGVIAYIDRRKAR